jgi:hypothetical protein
MPDLQSLSSSLESFDSYRLDMSISFEELESETGNRGMMRFQSARTAEPPASEVIVTLEGDLPEEMEGADTLTFTEIGDQAYSVFPGFGCITGTADEMGGTADDFSGVIETDDLVGDIEDAEYLGEETLDGVPTFHYRFDESNAQQEGGLDDMEGHVYISQEDGYVVRLLVDGVGELDLFDTGDVQESAVHIEYNVTDVNGAFVVEPPESCAGAGTDYPVIEGATDLTTMAGFTSYKVDAALDDAVAFYDAEMAARGYTSSEDQMVLEETAILTYSGDDGPVNVTITEDDGLLSVLITSPQSE